MTDALIGDIPTEPRKVDPDAIGAEPRADVVPKLTYEQMELLTDDELKIYLAALRVQEEGWDLFPRQQLAVELLGKVKALLYGGAAGGGKTDLGCKHAYDRCQAVPNMRVLYVRTSFPELKRTAIVRCLEKFDPNVAEYNRNDKVWRFRNGSELEFGYLESDDDVYQYKSAEYDIIIMDEASEFSYFQFVYLFSRLRTSIEKKRAGSKPHMLLMTNPEGKGVAWLKRYFVEATDRGRRVVTYLMQPDQPDSEITVAFVPSKVTDNPHIDPDYRKSLTMLPEIKRRQLLEGDWDTFEGMFFPEFEDSIHVIKPFEIPETWERVRGIDHGYTNPTACVWVAFDEDDRAYVYREYQKTKTLPSEHASNIIELSAEPRDRRPAFRPEIRRTMADSAMWARTGHAKYTIAEQFRQAGLPLNKSNKNRTDGWTRLRELLHVPDVPNPQPGIFFFDTCGETIKCLKGLTFQDADKPGSDPDDCNKVDDHLADALRYVLMSRRRRAPGRSYDSYSHLDSASARAARFLAERVGRRTVNRADVMR